MTVGETVEAILKERGITKTSFADMSGVKKQNVNKLLDTQSYVNVQRMAEALGVDVLSLLRPNNTKVSDCASNANQTIRGYLEIGGEYIGVIAKMS